MTRERRDTDWPVRFAPYAPAGASYALRDVDLVAALPVADAMPAASDEDRAVARVPLRSLARDAVGYGFPAALQYANLCRTVLGPGLDRRPDGSLAVPVGTEPGAPA